MCHIPKGDMPLTLSWSFRGQILRSNDAVSITKMGDRSSILAIAAATEKHTGNYTCIASNTVASTNHTATLNVQGIPMLIIFILHISFIYHFIFFILISTSTHRTF